jgi:serine/threonine protein kinase
VDKLHRAGIAHRSLRAANVMADPAGRLTIVDFSFSELDATRRQTDLDVAELLAVLAGEDRVVSAAAGILGAGRLARAVPLLQPLAAASGQEPPELARVQRVRPRTLLAIAALTGAFYYLLPKLAQVGSSWHVLQSAYWI